MARRKPFSYKDSLRWILANDCTEFLRDTPMILSVSASFCADIYDRSDDEIKADLLKMVEQIKIEEKEAR